MRWLVVILVCAGCQDIELSAMHPPPPGATLEVDRDAESIELSVGTAAAIECSFAGYDPCADLEVISEDAVITIYPLHIGGLDSYSWTRDSPRSGFVVLGNEIGSGELEIRSNDGEKHYRIEVVE